MYRWQGLQDVPANWGRSVVTIGVFDGVHRGHRLIVARAAEIAATLGLPLVVVTFDPHPDEVVRPGSHPPLLCTPRYRVQLLGQVGADAVCMLPFTREFSQLPAEEFVRTVLVDGLHAAAVVIGENFRFGHKAAGNVTLLAELGEKYEFAAEGVTLLTDEGVTISSSQIRDLLAVGEVEAAARELCRPHRVEGIVVRGQQRGRALGFPTANAEPPPNTAIPADGIYAGWLASLDTDGTEQERWPAAISVGTNPTFDGSDRTVEAYALDRDDLDLYGVHVAVEFAERIRRQIRFDSVDGLVTQMHQDVAAARLILAPPGASTR
ncbi:MAG TPA: bifunctional riboflavin kinase/FAD synthetase [Streptosporangiaceae bacterium]|nr:bifunctional riboflavin kinase/FAD synthetase [Streptosporangiaceae bacterium]